MTSELALIQLFFLLIFNDCAVGVRPHRRDSKEDKQLLV